MIHMIGVDEDIVGLAHDRKETESTLKKKRETKFERKKTISSTFNQKETETAPINPADLYIDGELKNERWEYTG